MTVIFPTPKKKLTLKEEVRLHQQRQVRYAADMKRRQASPPKNSSGAAYRKCAAVDCVETPCDRGAYARDPLARKHGEMIWVCRNAYMRSWRTVQNARGLRYDARHRQGVPW